MQPLSVQATSTAKPGWTTKQKVLAAAGLAALFVVLVAVVVSYRGHPMTTGEFRGAREWLTDWWRSGRSSSQGGEYRPCASPSAQLGAGLHCPLMRRVSLLASTQSLTLMRAQKGCR
jgi:hypothetical protein